jgi:hypothetical protein
MSEAADFTPTQMVLLRLQSVLPLRAALRARVRPSPRRPLTVSAAQHQGPVVRAARMWNPGSGRPCCRPCARGDDTPHAITGRMSPHGRWATA